MDPILIAAALRRDMTIVTRDAVFADHGAASLW